MTEASLQFRLMQSWWLAGELVRRHPSITVIETHPGDGQYDCLSLFADKQKVVDINRAGSVHLLTGGGLAFDELFHLGPAAILGKVEPGARLTSPKHAPPSTPAALTYRVLAQVMAITVNHNRPCDVRNEYGDTSGYGGGQRHYVDKFPVAAERARQHRPGDLLDNPLYRYWGVLRAGKLQAVLDTDGFAYVGENVLHLPTLYATCGRKLTALVAASLGPLLP